MVAKFTFPGEILRPFGGMESRLSALYIAPQRALSGMTRLMISEDARP
jgi:hypothetical protein